jgi:hypothetical protein
VPDQQAQSPDFKPSTNKTKQNKKTIFERLYSSGFFFVVVVVRLLQEF